MEWFDKILNFFVSSTHSFGKKAAFGLIILAGLWFSDWYTGFTKWYRIERKLEQIDKLEKIKKDYTLNDTIKIELYALEKEILEERRILDLDYLPFLGPENTSTSSDTTYTIPNATKNPNTNIRNPYLHIVSSSFTFLLMFLTLPLTIFSTKVSGNTILGLIAVEIILIFLIFIYSYSFGLIPIISKDNIWINYILNFILHWLSIILFAVLVTKANKPKATS